MNDDMKSSISKLRSLREELCNKQSKWKEAFHVKDEIVEQLKALKMIADAPDSTKQCVSNKIDSLLILLDPERESEQGEKNE